MEVTTLTRTYENTSPPANGVLRLRGAPETIQDGVLTITPIIVSGDSSFGAEVSGVDWSKPVPEKLVKQVSATRI